MIKSTSRKFVFFLNSIIIFISASTFAQGAKHYRLFIDAGSSGSRVHIIESQDSGAIPILTDVFFQSTKPGLSAFANQPEQAGASLKAILDEATHYLVNQQVSLEDTSINILATAGMRLLSENQQEAIYKNIRSYIKEHYAYRIDEVKTIDGKLEGLYGWLDVNYLLGNFQQNKPTVGSIDMGGASVEVAFATNDLSKMDDELSIEINHQHYTVFTKSILGLGQDQARLSMLASLDAKACFPKNYEFETSKIGNYHFSTCQIIYQQVIQKHVTSQPLPLMDNQKIVAYSGIYYAYEFFNEKEMSSPSLSGRIKAVCDLPWDELQKRYPAIEKKYLVNYCANGTYIDELLFGTYKLKADQLIVSDKLEGKVIDWTLGAALYQWIKQDKA